MVSVTVKCTNQGILRRKFLVIFDSCLYRSDQYSLRDKKRNLEKSLLLLTGLPHVRKWSGKKKDDSRSGKKLASFVSESGKIR